MWRELGELRLLHLLEDPSMIRSLLSLLDTSEFVFPLNSGTNHLPIDIKHISTVPIRTDFDTASRSGSNSDAPGHLSSINVSASVSAGAADPLMNSRGASSNVKGNERQKQARNSTLVLVAKAIIETLSTLRSEGDRVWVVVSIGLYHISSSIFNISPANKFITVNESQHRLLTDLLQNQNVADWVVLGVLLAADAFASHGIEKEVQTDEMNRLGSENDIKEVQMRVTRNSEAHLPIENIFPEYHRKRALLNDISSPTLATIPDYFCLILSRTVLPLSKGDSVSLKSLIKNTRPHLL